MLDMEDLYRLLRTGHVQAQGIVDTVATPLLVLNESLCVQAASRSFFETFKVDRYETIGQQLYELGNGQWDIAPLRQLLLEVVPKATALIDYEVEHDFPDLGRRTMLLTARTLHHPDNGSRSMLLSIADVTDRYRRDAAKDLVFGELRHRMKNLLSVIQAMARQTTTAGRSAEEFRNDFLGRFEALIGAQSLAFAEDEAVSLLTLLERVLAPYMGQADTIEIEPAPAVMLTSPQATSLGLVMHELGTNAAKHGALSVAAGQVRVSWQLEDHDRRFRLTWAERGGPPVSPPHTSGYGSRLIQSATIHGLGGQVEQDYAQDGLRVEIRIPLAAGAEMAQP